MTDLVAFLQNNGLMDPYFPYPLTFATCYGVAMCFFTIILAFILVWLGFQVYAWLFRFF